ncbi:LacI family DNA-binding transcriptional regulator [Actinomadura opuntiae]|uniref:LacI family DNA-binding transcriptional regulator n=1 Tax=Actinomadura sp. OS1-43 TaxID=604315 RepID=UPI00255A8E8E|nr:LacI family DNA-binding transcriptional regulator [Actinomadura sp. OS1-43]MDL4818492.1 LacI family DNA-binding transcriptional regulator [Actinomadura sp. OS1-43]
MSNGGRSAQGTPTLEDVARVAGVSRATVSRVVNGIRNVSPEIQEAVWKAVATTGYAPNRAARSLVTRRTGTVALIISGVGEEESREEPAPALFEDPFFGRVVAGALGSLRSRGSQLVLMLADSPGARSEVVARLREGSCDGALVVSMRGSDPLPRMLVDAGQPTVLFAKPTQPVRTSYVDCAHRDGAKLAADHLVSRGRTRIAAIAGPLDVPAAQERLVGFQEALVRHDLPCVGFVESDFTQAGGQAAMERLLRECPDVDGVFAANDLMAHGAVLVLRDHGRRVPEDVAVVGYDDSSAALAGRPQLTTVRQPVEEMVGEMVDLLLNQLERPSGRVTSVVFDPTLVVRQSS